MKIPYLLRSIRRENSAFRKVRAARAGSNAIISDQLELANKMTTYASEEAFLKQQLKNQKSALVHFKKSKDQFYKDNPTIDLYGSKDCIDDYYLLLEDKIKEEMASIRTRIRDA